ncbi:MAG: molybdopterin cofactor-binding domain-containing protein [Terriglobales bacterium]
MADRDLTLEIKQHEVTGGSAWFELERRDFLKVLGGGLLVCVAAPGVTQESGRRQSFGHELPSDIASWLHIAEDGRVTVFTGKVEMGQGIRTSLAQQVAEELHVPVASMTMVMGDTALTPWDAGTFGSRTTPTMGPELRTMAVAARELLVNMAAQKWNVDAKTLVAANGNITNPASRQSISYGELTQGKKLAQVVEGDPSLTPASEWKIIGQPVPRTNGAELLTGKHQYPSDLSRPGMMFGKIVRPSGFNAKLSSVDTSTAEKMAGVMVVRDGDFIGVVASDSHTAHQATEAIKAEWEVPAQPSNATLFDYLRKNVDTSERGFEHVTGSVEQAMAAADVKLESTYTVQYIAHSPLEPRAAVAEWNADKLTVWTGSQRPFAIKGDLAQAFRMPTDNVRVIIPDTGSGYGGKHTSETSIEAARLAKAAGKPVKVNWTREEEFTWAYFRPAGVIDVRSAAKKDGTIVAWEFHNYNSGPAAIGTPYEIANQKIQFHPVKSPLRQGSYRGLAGTANFFARECHMDELAHAGGMDPLEFRLKNLSNPRVRAVLQTAAEKFGWGKEKSSPQRGFGIACGTEKGSYIATCAEIEIANGMPKIGRIVQAFECGAVVNPDGLRNQVEGAVVQAIGGALFEQIRFEHGRILNAHMAQYRVPRFADVPKIEVVIVDRKDLPSAGAGETPIMGLAPAVANAIFAATGKRLRGMPLNSAV